MPEGTGSGEHFDVVVYGGGFAGVAAAVTAAQLLPAGRVLLVAPESLTLVGGTFTAGGQNYWDTRLWQGDFPQAGSFARWYGALGQYYSTADMAALLADELQAAGVTTAVGWDFSKLSRAASGQLTDLLLRSLDWRDGMVWGRYTWLVSAPVFIDASDDGRLARLAGAGVTVGRADWPSALLLPDERGPAGRPLMQAVTLMFKLRGVTPGDYSDMSFDQSQDADGRNTWGCWGGVSTYGADSVVTSYNDQHGPQGWALKPLNAAQDGPDSDEWWVNTLLLFGVDGRAHRRDAGTWRYPAAVQSGALQTDAARVRARTALGDPAFIAAMRRFPGFGGAELVPDEAGNPRVAEVLYRRETLHAVRNTGLAAGGSEETNYILTPSQAAGAGAGYGGGAADDVHYARRIGLGFYNLDINAYRFSDLRTPQGYVWPVTARLRSDVPTSAGNPVYLPMGLLGAPAVGNLLVPGAATGCASLAWAELRVGPNACVLGDAAGAVAARMVQSAANLASFAPADVDWVQEALRSAGARLDK